MKTQAQLIAKFGDPYKNRLTFERMWMMVWEVPDDIREAIPAIPKRIYLNRIILIPLKTTLRKLISTGLHEEIETWDGCFNIRPKRGSSGISTHSWGIAVDLNAALNPFRGKVTWSDEFVQVWRDIGWICGADWSAASKDGMHFQWENF
ncbi:M15 family metallopeptidase [Dyadobacter sp. CY261]|uniref:M15 family metallopeptidase n=1 Tax=Dyadobacter sp. CY261 TaxID=2907203 RepID=UPI001F30FA81|nr:M15 family metallopeptidase [Dyadobacter sp. CY261]MCF0075769.1 M15 family metallopeptidase [Dyadobacter sp. CY261]